MKPNTRSETARALWATGIRKAKIMADIMRAFNLIERDIYIRGAEAKIDFAMYEKTDDNLNKGQNVKKPFYIISPLSFFHLIH